MTDSTLVCSGNLPQSVCICAHAVVASCDQNLQLGAWILMLNMTSRWRLDSNGVQSVPGEVATDLAATAARRRTPVQPTRDPGGASWRKSRPTRKKKTKAEVIRSRRYGSGTPTTTATSNFGAPPSHPVRTRCTWEPQSVTLQYDSFVGLTIHGLHALNSVAAKEDSKDIS